MQTVDQLCLQRESRTIEQEETGFTWCTMASLDAEPRQCEESPSNGKLWVKESRISMEKGQVMGETVLRKPRICVRSPTSGGARSETEARNGSCGVTKDGVAGTSDNFDA